MRDKNHQINFYDDHNHDYEDFWVGRDYEHIAEVVAIKQLLGNRHYAEAIDYGGGYGRLARVILANADHLLLVEPSLKQLNIARKKLHNEHRVSYIQMTENNSVPLRTSSIDLALMVRVSHHLPDMHHTLYELSRLLKPGGHAIIEIANHTHILNRIKFGIRCKRLSEQPVQVGIQSNGIMDETPFVNHNPKTVIKELQQLNFRVVRVLSVSNLRSRLMKKIFSLQLLIAMEEFLQPKLAKIYFGPSIFILLEKAPQQTVDTLGVSSDILQKDMQQ